MINSSTHDSSIKYDLMHPYDFTVRGLILSRNYSRHQNFACWGTSLKMLLSKYNFKVSKIRSALITMQSSEKNRINISAEKS